MIKVETIIEGLQALNNPVADMAIKRLRESMPRDAEHDLPDPDIAVLVECEAGWVEGAHDGQHWRWRCFPHLRIYAAKRWMDIPEDAEESIEESEVCHG